MNTLSPSRNTMARKPSHFGSKSHPSPGGSSSASLASMGATGGWITRRLRARSRRPAPALGDAALGGGPPGVERAAPPVDVDHQGRVVGGDGLALARLAVALRPHCARLRRLRPEQVVDAHPIVLVDAPR